MLLFLSSVAIIAALFSTPITCIRIERSRYLDINIEISPKLPSSECQSILTNLKQTLTEASLVLYSALDGRVHFGSFNIILPRTWDDSCLSTDFMPGLNNRTASSHQSQLPSAGTGGRVYITITDTHHVYGNNMWTQQYGGCGIQGDQIYVPYQAISSQSAKEFVRNWAKFRYGIFDEMGFRDDPVYPLCYFDDFPHVTGCSDTTLQHTKSICASENPYKTLMKAVSSINARTSLMFAPQADSVVRFCDDSNHNRYAPNKQNLLCDRRSTLDVILQHSDFAPANQIPAPKDEIINTQPKFNYRRRKLTRYVVIVEDSQDVMLRDSWSFLRSAIRKWVLYDLQPQTAVGIVLANGQLIGKSLPITPLISAKNRDLVASFVPYSPSDSRQVTCISCALEQALKMFNDSENKYGYAAQVLLIISPGMEFSSSVVELSKRVLSYSRVRIATINYPAVLRRQPLDALAHATDGKAYSVYESKFNGEKSYLQTYLALTTVLNEIGRSYYEGVQRQLPIEIHRMTLQDTISTATALSQRASHRFNGTFFIDANFGYPAGFYIYTYSAESPLIQAMRLTSPTGHIYETRSDQRMPVKQLSLVTNLNETGYWTYDIERFHGNPQPHIVQVLATPLGEMSDFIRMRTWAERHGRGSNSYIVIYCELKHGNYPVMEADVRVSVKRYDHNCNNKPQKSDCNVVYRLLDSGSGSPDIMRGDGIYSRLFIVREPSVYILDIWATSLKDRTYTILNRNTMLNAHCCGSELAPPIHQQGTILLGNDNQHNNQMYTNLTVPFERYAAPLTFHIDTIEFDGLKPNEQQPHDYHILGETEDAAMHNSNITIGRIADLQLAHVEDGKLLLRWLEPDFADSEVARYELKYGFQLSEMVDRFDSASVLWSHETPTPLPAGVEQRFIIDPRLEPKMLNQSVYFGLRAYTVLNKGAKPGPVSNIVGTFVAVSPQIETKETVDDLEAKQHQNEDDAIVLQYNNSTTRVKVPGESTASSQLWDVLLAISIALAIILALLVLLCVLWKCRSVEHKKAAAAAAARVEATEQAKEAASLPIDSVESTTLMQQGNNYANLDVPDRQTIGIPIFECNDDDDNVSKNKRLSAYGSLAALQCSGLQGFVKDDLKQQHKIPNDEHNPFYSGLSIISMQTETLHHNHNSQPAQLPPPLNYDTWSQSSLLLRDGQRGSPFSETLHSQPIKLGYMPPRSVISDPNAEHFSSLDFDIPPVPPLPISPQLYRNNSSPFTHTTALHGGISIPHNTSYDSSVRGQHQMENNKRLRNATMV